MINFETWYRERIKAEIFTVKPYPIRPFRKKDWVGVAFNRDKNKLCAPDFFWKIVLSASREQLGEGFLFCVGASDVPPGVEVKGGGAFENDYEKLSDFLLNDYSYLSTMYIAGASERWAYWGDQDFSIFGGHHDFMEGIFLKAGGKASLQRVMFDQFDVDEDLDDEMMSYITNILNVDI